MQREIKFRAWIKKDKRMEKCIDVNPFHVSDCDRLYWKHDEVALMQYTGLKDKNGKEIYEGDIVKTTGHRPNGYEMEKREHISVIEHWNSYVNIGYRLRNSKGKTLMIKSQAMLNTMQTEVIGNIFDNPELLQEVEK